MNTGKRLLSIVLLTALAVFGMAFAAQAETLRPKVDNFILFFDHSGSMVQDNEMFKAHKLVLAKSLALSMNAVIPELGYQSGVNTFAPFETQLTPRTYTRPAVASAVTAIDTEYDIYGRNTPMGFGLDKIDPVLATLKGRTALIVFTDGDSNYGNNPVAEAQALYAKYPNLCIHIVSYADKDHGKEVVAQIRALKGCSVVGDPMVMTSAAGMNQFVRDVFYETAPEQAAAPRAMTPAAAPAGTCETITLGNMNFAFDKYMIVPDMVPALEQALSVLKNSSCEQFIITGHTDSVGSVEYNQKLSERRANSVTKWLMEKGFQGKLSTEGKGKLDPKFDNKTAEGRHLNRRVEISTK
ncbi:MAG: flagellar motor protein MotB [Deltaproteobacteria bacterium HGW-Deltaproteobacteria-8]|jgi:OOP family OmpA-OmpF porin|nr:MAG: flagellar motor protein MotB [Deltaproteobacteria bacterium HGW-Deltaproteobacteria-8]